ncbi:UNVERIFIED_ORG: hypothetical protein GGI63_005214 [Rhizobium esperanzae]
MASNSSGLVSRMVPIGDGGGIDERVDATEGLVAGAHDILRVLDLGEVGLDVDDLHTGRG